MVRTLRTYWAAWALKRRVQSKRLMHIYLIGYRGSGKSTVGKRLAARLGRPLFDTDEIIEGTAKQSIKEIFESQGESVFRDMETIAVKQLAATARATPAVVSLGGGSVLREENRNAISESGDCIWLSASAEFLFDRIQGDQSTKTRRPNLLQGGGFAEVAELLRQRLPVYQKMANLTIEVEGKTPDEICDEIIACVNCAARNESVAD